MTQTPTTSHCIYRNQVIATETCTNCPGRPRIKIFACELHTTCTIGKAVAPHRCCADCADFKPPRSELPMQGGRPEASAGG